MQYPEATKIKELIDAANSIVIIQADNPDADSLSSALALEHILGDMGKEVHMYCGVDMPTYLNHLSGWDRVEKDIPKNFDLSIFVDVSASILLEQLTKTGQLMWIKNKPSIVIDHHDTESDLDFVNVSCIYKTVSATEIIYELSKQLDWTLNHDAMKFIVIGILSDSLGFTTDGTTARSIHIVGELVEAGVNIAELEEARRQTLRKEAELVHYKGKLLQRVEYFADNRIAMVTIPFDEIEQYSHMYNPSVLVMDDMRLTKNTDIAISFKQYPDNRITAKIRSNYGRPIASKVAEHFGGGGHPYASGFKVQDGRTFEDIKNETIKITTEILDSHNGS